MKQQKAVPSGKTNWQQKARPEPKSTSQQKKPILSKTVRDTSVTNLKKPKEKQSEAEGQEDEFRLDKRMNQFLNQFDNEKWQEISILLSQELKSCEETEKKATLLFNLALAHRFLGNLEQAGKVQAQCSQLDQEKGEQTSNFANSLSSMAFIYLELDQLEFATKLFEKALEIYRKVLGPQNFFTSNTLYQMALIEADMLNFQQAYKYQKEDLEIRKKITGKDSIETSIALANLALIYQKMNQPKDAEMCLREVLEVRKKNLPKVHILNAEATFSLSQALAEQENFKEAQQKIDEATAIYKDIYGEENIQFAKCLTQSALINKSLGKYKNSITSLQQSIAIYKKLNENQENEEVFYCMSNLAQIYLENSQLDLALQTQYQVYELHKKLFADDKISYVEVLRGLIEILKQNKKYTDAQFYQKEEIQIRKEDIDDQEELANSYYSFAVILKELGQLDDCITNIHLAIENDKIVFGDSSPNQCNNLATLAQIYKEKGDLNKAYQYQLDALEMSQGILGKEHLLVANSGFNLSIICKEISEKEKSKAKLEDAIKFQYEALQVYKKLLPKEHPQYVQSSNYFLLMQKDLKNFKE